MQKNQTLALAGLSGTKCLKEPVNAGGWFPGARRFIQASLSSVGALQLTGNTLVVIL
jgi:hypothetical protein